MYRYKAFAAYLLLLLFCRVMVPEAAVLALHDHEHTEHKAVASGELVGKVHAHCDIDKLFNSSFIYPAFAFELIQLSFSGYYKQPYSFAWKFTFPNNSLLRGPPRA